MDILFGADMPLAVKFFFAFVIVLGSDRRHRLPGAPLRRRAPGRCRGARPPAAPRGDRCRGRRRTAPAVLIRRDNVEHLLMIGGPSDVVVEANIVRAGGRRAKPRRRARRPRAEALPRAGAARRRQHVAAAARACAASLRPATRPARDRAEQPMPGDPPRELHRVRNRRRARSAEPAAREPTMRAEPVRAPKPRAEPRHAARAEPRRENRWMVGRARAAAASAAAARAQDRAPPTRSPDWRQSSRAYAAAPEPSKSRAAAAQPPRRAARPQPVPRRARRAAGRRRRPPKPSRQSAADQNLAEMAQRLEAALRRPARTTSRARAEAATSRAESGAASRNRPRRPTIPSAPTAPHADAARTPRRSRARARADAKPAPQKSRLRQPRTGDGELARPPEQQSLDDISDRPLRPSRDGGGRCSGRSSAAAVVSGRRAGHQHQFRPGRRRSTERVIQLIAFITVLSLAPSILIMMTSFTRIVVVLSLLRTALGTATAPPNAVIVALALFLTAFVMGPALQTRLRRRHPPADQQRDHRRAGVRARVRAAQGVHAEERAREGPGAVHRPVARAARRRRPRNCRCASWCRPS